MLRQRRILDETGGSVYYNIDAASNAVQSTWSGAGHSPPTPSGAGVFDTARALAANVVTKLTGKAAKRIAEKAVEKAVEKGAEKVGEKTGQLLGEKIYDRFNSKSSNNSKSSVVENRGDLIYKELQKIKKPPGDRKSQDKVMEDKSISQQFEDLLNLF